MHIIIIIFETAIKNFLLYQHILYLFDKLKENKYEKGPQNATFSKLPCIWYTKVAMKIFLTASLALRKPHFSNFQINKDIHRKHPQNRTLFFFLCFHMIAIHEMQNRMQNIQEHVWKYDQFYSRYEFSSSSNFWKTITNP